MPKRIRIDDIDLKMFHEVWPGTPEHTEAMLCAPDMVDIRLWVFGFIKWALDNQRQAIHFMRDEREGCLRQLVFGKNLSGELAWEEALPMPPLYATVGIEHMKKIVGLTRAFLGFKWENKRAYLKYMYKGVRRKLKAELLPQGDVVLYLTDERPWPCCRVA